MPAPRPRDSGSRVIEHLNASAPVREVNHIIPLDKYYRSAKLLERQAEDYRRIKNSEQLYVMLMRYASLIVETIPKHKEYNKSDAEMQQFTFKCSRVLSELEALRRELHLQNVAQLEEAPFSPTAAPGAVLLSAGTLPGLEWDGVKVTSPADLSALERLGRDDWTAALEGETAAAAAAAAKPPPPPLPAVPLPDLPDLTPSIHLPAASQAILSKHAVLPIYPGQGGAAAAAAQQRPGASASYNSPLQGLSLDATAPSAPVFPPPPPPSPYSGQVMLGPQELGVQGVAYPTVAPGPNDTCCQPPPPGTMITALPQTGVSEPKKRKSIRDVHVSMALMNEFLRYAMSNTRRGIETCGILAGVLSPDDARFTVTTLIVPKQEGTSDTVQALAEEEIFEAQDSRGLYPLGWIHTHPSQTCFLSSIDIHTQCGYQTMLDEAVAIVMAPQDARDKVGIFRLSTPGGLSLIQKCPLRGFHTHPPTKTGQPVYELSNHVYLNPRVAYEVVDLR